MKTEKQITRIAKTLNKQGANYVVSMGKDFKKNFTPQWSLYYITSESITWCHNFESFADMAE